jgi:hypothetical protein
MLERLHKRVFDLFFISAMAFCVSLFWSTEGGDLPFVSLALGWTSLLAIAVLLPLTVAKMLRAEDQDSV